MQANQATIADLNAVAHSLAGAVRVGRVIGCSLQGLPVVDYPGNTHGPLVARVAVACNVGAVTLPPRDADVLLVFDSGDPAQPIVLGMLAAPDAAPGTEGLPASPAVSQSCVDSDIVDLEGRKQLTLRCGKSSISLFADGRIVLKGTRLVSRASETNKIKGAIVELN